MNWASHTGLSDERLLRCAKEVLVAQGFQVESVDTGIQLLLAENSYFIVAVAAMNTINDLILAEPVALELLSHRLKSAELGPKMWDTYLVMLTQEKSAENDDITRDLYSINYDTSRLRRIAHTGVDPDDVRLALAPFVEPDPASTAVAEGDAFGSLLDGLVSRGVNRELAQRAIAAFKQGAALDDIL